MNWYATCRTNRACWKNWSCCQILFTVLMILLVHIVDSSLCPITPYTLKISKISYINILSLNITINFRILCNSPRICVTSSATINTLQRHLPCICKKNCHTLHRMSGHFIEWRRKNSFDGFNSSMHSHVITVAPPAAGMFGDKYSLIIAK
jgi:hypothetical protein